ncbi:MAG TPA: hypothetical protein VF912_11035 [Anaeromyxobacter sp.]
MRRLLAALALALFAACAKSPCQELGEKLCGCTGIGGTACTTQVGDQLKALDPPNSTQDKCDALLASCNGNKPPDADFCEWLLTENGKTSCGLAPPP